MKRIALSLIALAAVSSVAFANENRSWDLRDSDTYFGKYAEVQKPAAPAANAFAVAVDNQGRRNFERMKQISEENQNGGH